MGRGGRGQEGTGLRVTARGCLRVFPKGGRPASHTSAGWQRPRCISCQQMRAAITCSSLEAVSLPWTRVSRISDLQFAPESSFGKNVMFCVRALAACNCCRDPHPGFRMKILILTCESEHALQHHLKEFMVQSYLLSVIAGLLLHWKTNLHCLL